MKRPLLQIEITSNSERIGAIATADFRKSVQAPQRMSLAQVVEKWNAHKATLNEPERAAIVINSLKRPAGSK